MKKSYDKRKIHNAKPSQKHAKSPTMKDKFEHFMFKDEYFQNKDTGSSTNGNVHSEKIDNLKSASFVLQKKKSHNALKVTMFLLVAAAVACTAFMKTDLIQHE